VAKKAEKWYRQDQPNPDEVIKLDLDNEKWLKNGTWTYCGVEIYQVIEFKVIRKVTEYHLAV
jgi:hypothetical protein